MIPIVMGMGIALLAMVVLVLWADRNRVDVIEVIEKKHQQFVNRNKINWTVTTDESTVTKTRRMSSNLVFEVFFNITILIVIIIIIIITNRSSTKTSQSR